MTDMASPESPEATFNSLLLRNKALIWHVCSDFSLGMAWKTEDCVQEVIINLWQDYGKFEGRSSEKTWVYRVATNTMLMLRRKQLRTPPTELMTESNEMIADLDADDNRMQLQQLIDTLPEKDSSVIRAFLDGFSYKEIAEMTNNSVGAIAMRIARTKRKLKQLYIKENK